MNDELVVLKQRTPEERELYYIQKITELEGQLAWQKSEWLKLNQLYAELADTWNAFQALHRPTQRNVHRAEATGYLARKLIQLLYKDDAPMDLEQLKRLLE